SSLVAMLAILVGGIAVLSSSNASADVRPGDVITTANADKVKDITSPGTFYKVQNGMSMKIIPTGRIDWPPPYKDSTEKYSPQVKVGSDGRSIIGYVAGLPFPLLDPNDPQIAVKIMWNNAFRPIFSDDYDLRFFDCESVYEKVGQKQS